MVFPVYITTYNCENAIEAVIKDLKTSTCNADLHFYFIDNDSSDRTIELILNQSSIQQMNNVTISRNKPNIGLGGSQKFAFSHAKSNGFERFAVFHGDNQPLASDLVRCIRIFNNSHLDVIFGSRFMKNSTRFNYDATRLAGNLILNSIYSLRFGKFVYDLGSGLNLFRTDAFFEIETLPNDLNFNCHLLIKVIKQKMQIHWEPIGWREGMAPSNLKKMKLGFQSLAALFGQKNKFAQEFKTLKIYGE